MAHGNPHQGLSAPALGLVGRELELVTLGSLLEAALAGRGGAAYVSGEPGMGKTSLVSWASDRARERGATVADGRCWEGIDAPAYWPWTQIVRRLADHAEVDVSGAEESVMARLVPEVAHASAGGPPVPSSRFDEFQATTSFFVSAAKQAPLVLVLDDLHAADESSLLMLQFLTREIQRASVLVLATYDEAAAGRRGDHGRILNDIARDGAHIRLGGLDAPSVARLYESITGEKPQQEMTTALHTATEGNPLFVIEATRMLVARGELHRPDYSTGFRVPAGVRDMFRRRIEALTAEASTLLSIASVLGRDFEVEVLHRVADLDVDTALDLLAEAVEAQLVYESGALGRFSFSHILAREALYEDLTAANRMRLHRRAAEVLETLYADNLAPRLPELAHHWFKAAQAGDPQKTLEFAVRAAEQAAERGAFEEAVRLYRRAVKTADLAGISAARMEDLRDSLVAAEEASGAAQEATTADPMVARFAREGEFWTITYLGTTSRLKDSKGLRLIDRLLKNPGREIHVLDLLRDGEPVRAARLGAEDSLRADAAGDAGEVIDEAAKAAYKRRLIELQAEVDEASEFNDPERAARAQQETDALLQQLAAAVGLGGRARRLGSEAERARVSITKVIKDALRKIGQSDRALGAHLTSTLKTGTFCSYNPDPRVPIEWQG